MGKHKAWIQSCMLPPQKKLDCKELDYCLNTFIQNVNENYNV